VNGGVAFGLASQQLAQARLKRHVEYAMRPRVANVAINQHRAAAAARQTGRQLRTFGNKRRGFGPTPVLDLRVRRVDDRQRLFQVVLGPNGVSHVGATGGSNAYHGGANAYQNTTYFGDGTHPTDAGQSIIAGIIEALQAQAFAAPLRLRLHA
jgi:hypothetical protein